VRRLADVPPVPAHLTDAYLATATNRLQGAGDLLWEAARDQLREGIAAGESHRRLATRIRKATGLALPRARVIARTEARDALLAGSLNQVRATGLTGTKTWVSVRRSPRTRPEHKHAHGQTVDLRGFFEVGGWPMDRPHDDTAPAELTISCRCGLKYSLDTADVLLGPAPERAPADDRLLRQVWAGGMVRAGVTVEGLARLLKDLGLTAAADDETFHLPGKHDQKVHGRRKSAGAPGSKAVPSGGKGGSGGTVGGTAYDDPAAAKKFLDDHYGTWKKKDLTDAEFAGLSFYQSPGFALMNGQLRGLKRGDIKADMTFGDSDLKRAKKASGDLTKGIAKAPPLPHAVQVHRGFDAGQFGDLSPGMTVTDKGFTSTSLTSSGVASVGRAGKPGVMRIELPAGTKAGAGSARELILPPGSSFQVVGVRDEGGTTMVDARLVGGGG
jgi:hypothetical protein